MNKSSYNRTPFRYSPFDAAAKGFLRFNVPFSVRFIAENLFRNTSKGPSLTKEPVI